MNFLSSTLWNSFVTTTCQISLNLLRLRVPGNVSILCIINDCVFKVLVKRVRKSDQILNNFIICVSGGMKCLFFGKFCVFCFLERPFWDLPFCLITDELTNSYSKYVDDICTCALLANSYSFRRLIICCHECYFLNSCKLRLPVSSTRATF